MGQTKRGGGGLTSETVESQVIELFGEKMNETVAPSDISACHQLPTTSTQKKNIIVKFSNRKTKDEILWNGRLLKGSQVYVNEHLTKKRQICRSWPATYGERKRCQQHGRVTAMYSYGVSVHLRLRKAISHLGHR